MSQRNLSPFSGIQSPRYAPNHISFPVSSTSGINQISANNLSPNQVSRIVGVPVKGGQKIKGESRITYMPYQKKITEFEERQYVERVPIKRKVIEYEERRFFEEVPREVTTTDYYAVENIKQYYKQIVPQKKIEMVPIEKKVKRVEYIPVQKQIVHYPEGQDYEYAKGQSRVILQNQGVTVRPDAVYRPIDPQLIYKYSNEHSHNPVGYVENGYKRNLSNAPTPFMFQSEGYFTGPPQTSYPISNSYNVSPRENTTSYRTIQDINIYPN